MILYLFEIFLFLYHVIFSAHDDEERRSSLVSALSTAYTVKSLPGAMLYIPVEHDYNTPVSLKRSLSDPEIYFPTAVKHSLIVAVNGLFSRERRDPVPRLGSCRRRPLCPPRIEMEETLKIDINVIQPTPNISPTCSMRSMSGESRDTESADPENLYAGIPLLIVPPSPTRVKIFSCMQLLTFYP